MAKKYKRLTIKQLRAYPGFENHTDEEAEKIIETLETLAIIFCKLFQKHQQEKAKVTGTDISGNSL